MKAIMLSVQPKYCELIASGKKTVEVRKTAPKLEAPFKCYIYQTAQSRVCNNCSFCKCELGITSFRICRAKTPNIELDERQKKCLHKDLTKGKVIGEFVCDKIEKYDYFIKKPLDKLIKGEYRHYLTCNELERTCLHAKELEEYLGEKDGYGWHISDLKIYDTPKELGEFKPNCKHKDCRFCPHVIADDQFPFGVYPIGCGLPSLTRPPQSWCYVEKFND